jgi:hypothetical protein
LVGVGSGGWWGGGVVSEGPVSRFEVFTTEELVILRSALVDYDAEAFRDQSVSDALLCELQSAVEDNVALSRRGR